MPLETLASAIEFLSATDLSQHPAELEKRAGEYIHGPQDPNEEKKDPVKELAIDAIKRHEGRQDTLYLDGSGHPTIGYGTKLSDQVFSSEDDPGFLKMKERVGRWSEEKMTEKLHEKYEEHGAELQRIYKEKLPAGGYKFEELPNEVQAHMLSNAYNMGASGYTGKFKNHFEAIYHGDFTRAAYELRYKDGLAALNEQPTRNSKWWNDVAGDTALERIKKGDDSYLKSNRGVDTFNVFLNAKFPEPEPDPTPPKEKVGEQLQQELNKSIS